jgi:hypothetical protein
MSWQIPTQVEQDIIAGKATYRTFQTGNGGQSILPVPANAYVVIFGYDFSPAGGGFKRRQSSAKSLDTIQTDSTLRWFETQQISFYTGTDFYPFIHHVDIKTTPIVDRLDATDPANESVTFNQYVEEINNSPIARQVYITSSNDVTITHGCILTCTTITVNPIPVTSRTPRGLTYGGSPGANPATQSNYGSGVTPLQFMQPSPKDYADFGFGLLPNNADGQAFATPDNANGLLDATTIANTILSSPIRNSAAYNYYLCLHYALYSKTIPETRG